MRRHHALALALALVAGSASAPRLAGAQATTELDRVEELARLGRAEEARAVLATWWDGPRTSAPTRDVQRGLWLRGRLTVDPAQAELDYQRLIVLYPAGPYAPQALFRLAQAAYARGDAEAAGNHVATLVRDYPTAPSRTQAETWLASAGAHPAPGAQTAVVPPTRGASPTAPGPTTAAPAGPPPTSASSTASASDIRPSPGRPVAPAEETLQWYVQFGAFSDEERAFDLQRQLVAAGLAARLVRVEGSGFLHVRLGRFATREEASRQLQDVTQHGFTAAIVRDERAEEVVRR